MKTLILISFLAFSSALAAELPDPTILKLQGSPEGYVAQGVDQTILSGDAEFFVNPWGEEGITVTVRLKDGKTWWGLSIAAPTGSRLHTKTYEDTLRAGNTGKKPWLSFGGCGRECNQASGEFQVLELAYDADGKPKRLAVDFHIKTGEGDPKNWIKGSVRFNSAIPLPSSEKKKVK